VFTLLARDNKLWIFDIFYFHSNSLPALYVNHL